MEIRNIAGMSTQELMACISEKKNEMEQKLKNGETEPTFSIGARSYTVKEWDKLIDKVDRNLDAVRKEQEQRREAQEKEALEEKASDQKEFLSILENSSVRRNIFMEKLNGTYKPAFPYEHLAKNGVISYHGVEFVCDAQKNAICLGDMSDKKNVLTIPLEGGGNLHRPVRLEVVLQQGDEHTGGRGHGVVQRVGQVAAALPLHPHFQPPSLGVP